MFNKKVLLLFVGMIGMLAITGVMSVALTKSPSEPIVFESNSSESTDFDDFASDADSDFDNESDDFDASMNYDLSVDAYSIEISHFIEYKNIFDLKFDLFDAEKEIRDKHSEDSYRLKDILVNKNESTDTGYNAHIMAEFQGNDGILRQEITLSYDLDESFDTWDLKGYDLVGEEKIYPELGDIEYSEIESRRIPFNKTGTFVYEAIDRELENKVRYRKLYIYFVAPRDARDYEVSTACLVLSNSYVYSMDYLNRTGDASVHERDIVSYDTLTNGLVRESYSIPDFVYNENGGVSEDRQYVRISDDILTPEDIADIWVNGR